MVRYAAVLMVLLQAAPAAAVWVTGTERDTVSVTETSLYTQDFAVAGPLTGLDTSSCRQIFLSFDASISDASSDARLRWFSCDSTTDLPPSGHCQEIPVKDSSTDATLNEYTAHAFDNPRDALVPLASDGTAGGDTARATVQCVTTADTDASALGTIRPMLVADGYTVHIWNPVYPYADVAGQALGPGGEMPVAEGSADYRGVMAIGLALADCAAGTLCPVAVNGATVVIPQSAFVVGSVPALGTRVCIGNDGADDGAGGDLRVGVDCHDRSLAVWGTWLGHVVGSDAGVSRTVAIDIHADSYVQNRIWRSANCATFDPGTGTAFAGDLCIETDEAGAYVCDTNTCEGAGWVIFSTTE